MIEVFKRLNVKVSCLGNHEMDFGLERMEELIKKTQPTTWVMSNIVEIKMNDRTGKTIREDLTRGLHRYKIINHQGIKIGIFGLCEDDWKGFVPSDVWLEIHDFVKVALEMSTFLKRKKCDYIIALTHMRVEKDRILAQECEKEIDLILGGHDHMNLFEVYNNGKLAIVKSGSDFKEFSSLEIDLSTRLINHRRVVVFDEELFY